MFIRYMLFPHDFPLKVPHTFPHACISKFKVVNLECLLEKFEMRCGKDFTGRGVVGGGGGASQSI